KSLCFDHQCQHRGAWAAATGHHTPPQEIVRPRRHTAERSVLSRGEHVARRGGPRCHRLTPPALAPMIRGVTQKPILAVGWDVGGWVGNKQGVAVATYAEGGGVHWLGQATTLRLASLEPATKGARHTTS